MNKPALPPEDLGDINIITGAAPDTGDNTSLTTTPGAALSNGVLLAGSAATGALGPMAQAMLNGSATAGHMPTPESPEQFWERLPATAFPEDIRRYLAGEDRPDTAEGMLRIYDRMQRFLDTVNVKMAAVSDAVSKMKEPTITAMMEAGITSVKISGRNYYLSTKMFPAYVGENEGEKEANREKLVQWLKAGKVVTPTGEEISTAFLVKEQFNHNSFMAFVTEQPLEEATGLPVLPEGMLQFVKISPKSTLNTRKG